MRTVSKIRIGVVDIETFPNRAYVWGKYEQDVIAFEREGFLASFAYKTLGEKKVYAYSLPDFPGYKKNPFDHSKLVRKLWEVMNEYDVIIAHNGDQFDIRRMNAFFIEQGLVPPSPRKTIDTKKVAKRVAMFNSNKLDDLGAYLHLGRKIETGGFGLWLKCLNGDKNAWKLFVKYNKNDVVLNEKLYFRLRPWIPNHPVINITESPSCPNCGDTHMQKRGIAVWSKGKKQRYQCKCGTWSSFNIIKTLS